MTTRHRSTAAKIVEESSDEEFKQLLASLPTHQGFIFKLYQFNGFWYSALHLQGILRCRSHFRPLDTDTFLVTAVKAGTTWLKALAFSLFNRAGAVEDLTTKNPHELIPFLELKMCAHDPDPQDQADDDTPPRLFSTHMPASALPLVGSGCKIVYLCRDPRDIFISYWHFSNRLRDPQDGDLPLEDAFDAFSKGISNAGPFWDHILGYWKLSLEMPSRVLFLKYEDMKGDTVACLSRLADFLGCPFSEDEEERGVPQKLAQLCSFDHLSGLEVNKIGMLSHLAIDNNNFFRRGEVGDWLNYFTPEITQRFDNLIKDKLHASDFNCY